MGLVNGNLKVRILQIHFHHPIACLQKFREDMHPLHLEVLYSYKLIEALHVYYWSLASILLFHWETKLSADILVSTIAPFASSSMTSIVTSAAFSSVVLISFGILGQMQGLIDTHPRFGVPSGLRFTPSSSGGSMLHPSQC